MFTNPVRQWRGLCIQHGEPMCWRVESLIPPPALIQRFTVGMFKHLEEAFGKELSLYGFGRTYFQCNPIEEDFTV